MPQETPRCFGEHWDISSRECVGGNDPAYVNTKTGSSMRPACSWRELCQQRHQHQKTKENKSMSGNWVPSSNLNRNQPRPAPRPMIQAPPAPVTRQQAPMQPQQVAVTQPQPAPVPSAPAPVQIPQQIPQQMPQQMPQPQQQIHTVAHQGSTVYTQPSMASQPIMVPMNQPMQGAETQSFLMVAEPVNPAVSKSQRLFRTLTRSAIKSTALALANFVDYETFGAAPESKE